MSTFITRRVVERTSSPQPVYPQVVDTTVRTWLPAAALLLSSFVTPARAEIDVRTGDWQPQSGWIAAVVDTDVRTWQPAATAELASFRTAGRDLRPRGDLWAPDDGWVNAPVDATVRTWPSASSALLAAYRTPPGPVLDVRRYEWSTSFFSIARVVDSVVATWLPALTAERTSFRTPARDLRPRGDLWAPDDGWVSGPVDAVVQTWQPAAASELLGFRTSARDASPRGSLWAPSDGWLFTNLPPAVTVPQTWPAFAQALSSFRTGAAAVLDPRLFEAPQFTWAQPVVDAVVRVWLPAMQQWPTTPARAQRFELPPPDIAWLGALFAPAATVAQTWPAMAAELASFRTPPARLFDARYLEAPIFSWTALPVDASVRLWVVAAGAELKSVRTDSRALLEVRLHDWAPAPAPWIRLAADADIRTWAPVFITPWAGLRVEARARLDVRRFEWTPAFFSQAAAVDAIVQKWTGTFAAELASFRTPARASVDVRRFEPPTFGLTPLVEAAVRAWMPALAHARASFLTLPRAQFDVRGFGWVPEDGWIGAVVVSSSIGATPAIMFVSADEIVLVSFDDPVIAIVADPVIRVEPKP